MLATGSSDIELTVAADGVSVSVSPKKPLTPKMVLCAVGGGSDIVSGDDGGKSGEGIDLKGRPCHHEISSPEWRSARKRFANKMSVKEFFKNEQIALKQRLSSKKFVK